MICQVCRKDKPLTYRLKKLQLESVCAPCIRQHYPWTFELADLALMDAVAEVLAWLAEHPHRDYLDAAFSVVAMPAPARPYSAGKFSTSRWPELIEAVKSVTQILTPASQ